MSSYWQLNEMKQYFNDKGEFHREDGPAIEWADSVKHWFIEGKRHQLDGPAVEWYDGKKEWYVAGHQYFKQDFPKAIVMFLFECNEEIAEILLENLRNFKS